MLVCSSVNSTVILIIDEEKIGQKRRKKINHFNQFFDASGGNPSSGGSGFFGSFGDGSSSSWSFGMGGGGATGGGGHGNMHSMGGNVSNYGNHQQQQYHSMMGPSRSYGAPSNPLPPVSSMFAPSQDGNFYSHYPNQQYGFRDRGSSSRSRPEVKSEHDPTVSGKCMLCSK